MVACSVALKVVLMAESLVVSLAVETADYLAADSVVHSAAMRAVVMVVNLVV